MHGGEDFMTRRNMISVICLTVLMLVGCRSAIPNYFAYRENDFSAEVRGELHGMVFSASISFEETDDGASQTVNYIGDGALSGVRVVCTGEGACIEREGVSIPCGADELSGLLAPLEVLLTEAEILAVKKEGKNTVLTLSQDTFLTLNENLIPCAYSSPELCFDVVWWENAIR